MRKIISILIFLCQFKTFGQSGDSALKRKPVFISKIDEIEMKGVIERADSNRFNKKDFYYIIGCGPLKLNMEIQTCLDSAYRNNRSRMSFNIGFPMTLISGKRTLGALFEIDKTIFKNKWAIGLGMNVFNKNISDTFNFNIKVPKINYRGFYFSIQHLNQIGRHFIFVQKINNGFAKSKLFDMSIPIVNGKDTTYKVFSSSTIYFFEPEVELFFNTLSYSHSDDFMITLGVRAGYRFTYGDFKFAESKTYNYPYFVFCLKFLLNAKKTKEDCCYNRG